MKKINTVLGPISPDNLGKTLMHEHVITCDFLLRSAARNWWDKEIFMERVKHNFGEIKKRGFDSIVDATTIDLSRDIDLIREVSEMCEINIVVTTGLYCFDLPWITGKSPQYLADILISEFENGITKDGGLTSTGVKPGIIKCASNDVVSDNNFKLLEATALAQKATNLPVFTHSNPAVAVQQMNVLLDLGIPPEKLMIGHTGDIPDVDLQESMLKRGVYLGFDRLGLNDFLSDEIRINNIVELSKRGWHNKLALSHDCSTFLDWIQTFQDMEGTDPNHSPYCHLADYVIPKLLAKGMDQETINDMIINLPKQFLQM